MRAFVMNIALFVVALLCCEWASAKSLGSSYLPYNYGEYGGVGRSRSSMEMGIQLGASYLSSTADPVAMNAKMGVRGALAMSLCWSEDFALQLEMGYIHNKIDANLIGLDSSAQSVKNGIFEVPILFSYRGFGPLRLNLGPVLSLAGTARYDLAEERVEFGRLRPTLALAASVGVELSRHVVLEARCTSGFVTTLNYFEGTEFSTRSHWLGFNLGYVF